MDLESHDTERVFGGETHYVREVGIECHDCPAVLNGEMQNLLVRCSRKGNLQDGNSVVTVGSQLRGMEWGKVPVQQEVHWLARTISSAARRAAYSRLALMCSDLSCGKAARVDSLVSPAASFSRIR